MRINHNISAINAHRQLGKTDRAMSTTLERLSSGLRINRAADDAAGLAISEKMRGQISGLNRAAANSQDGISLIQTAEGSLIETQSILQRMRYLAVQGANDTYTEADKLDIQKEIDQLILEIDRIAETTEFNTKTLLNGDLGLKGKASGYGITQIECSPKKSIYGSIGVNTQPSDLSVAVSTTISVTSIASKAEVESTNEAKFATKAVTTSVKGFDTSNIQATGAVVNGGDKAYAGAFPTDQTILVNGQAVTINANKAAEQTGTETLSRTYMFTGNAGDTRQIVFNDEDGDTATLTLNANTAYSLEEAGAATGAPATIRGSEDISGGILVGSQDIILRVDDGANFSSAIQFKANTSYSQAEIIAKIKEACSTGAVDNTGATGAPIFVGANGAGNAISVQASPEGYLEIINDENPGSLNITGNNLDELGLYIDETSKVGVATLTSTVNGVAAGAGNELVLSGGAGPGNSGDANTTKILTFSSDDMIPIMDSDFQLSFSYTLNGSTSTVNLTSSDLGDATYGFSMDCSSTTGAVTLTLGSYYYGGVINDDGTPTGIITLQANQITPLAYTGTDGANTSLVGQINTLAGVTINASASNGALKLEDTSGNIGLSSYFTVSDDPNNYGGLESLGIQAGTYYGQTADTISDINLSVLAATNNTVGARENEYGALEFYTLGVGSDQKISLNAVNPGTALADSSFLGDFRTTAAGGSANGTGLQGTGSDAERVVTMTQGSVSHDVTIEYDDTISEVIGKFNKIAAQTGVNAMIVNNEFIRFEQDTAGGGYGIDITDKTGGPTGGVSSLGFNRAIHEAGGRPGINGGFKLNDVAITIGADDEVTEIVQKINDKKALTDVEASYDEGTRKIKFQTMSATTGATVKLEETVAGTMKALGFTETDINQISAGASVQINGVSASDYTIQGNILTVDRASNSSINLTGLQVDLSNALPNSVFDVNARGSGTVDILRTSEKTSSGTVAMDVVSVADGANVTSKKSFGNDGLDGKTTLGINGKIIEFAKGTKLKGADGIIDIINNNTKDTGVKASAVGDRLKLETVNKGSAIKSENLVLTGMTDVFGLDGVTINDGADAVVNIDSIHRNDYKIEGNSVTVLGAEEPATSVDYTGMIFSVEDVSPGSGVNAQFDINVEDQSTVFQIGANEGQILKATINSFKSENLGINTDPNARFLNLSEINVINHEAAVDALDVIDRALNEVSGERAKLGAIQNRLDHTMTNLGNVSENLTAAESRIRDADMASEMMDFTKSQILQQAGTAMLAQANQKSQSVLQLLG